MATVAAKRLTTKNPGSLKLGAAMDSDRGTGDTPAPTSRVRYYAGMTWTR
jgi:hypothetical protein